MKTLLKFSLLVFLFLGNSVVSQNINHLKAINTDVWENFTKSFENSDYRLFSNLHSENLVRVGGDYKSIRGKTEYIEGYKKRWENKSINQTILFRFIERICDNEKASERGIYKLIINPNTENEQSYYGKFHVILNKENSVWKILVDYDSSENNSISEDSYLKAFDIKDFEKHEKQN